MAEESSQRASVKRTRFDLTPASTTSTTLPRRERSRFGPAPTAPKSALSKPNPYLSILDQINKNVSVEGETKEEDEDDVEDVQKDLEKKRRKKLKKALKFVEPGKYQKIAQNQLQSQPVVHKDPRRHFYTNVGTNLTVVTQTQTLPEDLPTEPKVPPRLFDRGSGLTLALLKVDSDGKNVKKLVQRVNFKGTLLRGGKKEVKPMELVLTKQERAKKKRQERRDKVKHFQEQIALGIIPPPRNKMSLRNMMSVLSNQHIAGITDPTEYEKAVLSEVNKRKEKHELENTIKKKTTAEKHQKRVEWIKTDRNGDEGEMTVGVWKVCGKGNLSSQQKFILEVNANKYGISGTALSIPNNNLVVIVVETGPKRFHKWGKLMSRMKWSDVDEEGNVLETTTETPVHVERVWTGYIRRLENEGAESESRKEFAFEDFENLDKLSGRRLLHYYYAANSERKMQELSHL